MLEKADGVGTALADPLGHVPHEPGVGRFSLEAYLTADAAHALSLLLLAQDLLDGRREADMRKGSARSERTGSDLAPI
jgi:hypothetical protein